ncbi:MAG: protoporphyrinogen oxidase [Proteobacteria bacterium]|nr:protoporphyrinogen oxidase [Pseudomonadota bacterium]
MTVDVGVIGGGVSGLAAAYDLTRQGYRVVVLERQVRAGGNVVSERIGGFLMEHGPSSVNGASAQAAALARALGLDGQRCELGSGVRYRYLVGGGVLRRIATHRLGFLTAGYLSPGARLRLLAEALVPPKDCDDETVAGFCTRRFGAEFTNRVIDPLVGGLFAGTANTLSMTAVFPALAAMERTHGSVVRALYKRPRTGADMPGRKLYSWRHGVASLPWALAARLGPALKTGVAVRRIRPLRDGYRIEVGAHGAFDARAVVVATQPHVAAALLENVDQGGADAAASFEAPPLAVVFLGYRRDRVDHPLDGLGYLSPRGEGRALTGAQFCSTMFSHRAPGDHVALAAYLGGARAPDLARLPPTDLVALARSEFRDLLGARGEPAIARVRQWPRGLPQYVPGHRRRVAALRAVERARPGLFLTGNYFTGPSIAACLAEACSVAVRAAAFLHGSVQKLSPGARSARLSAMAGSDPIGALNEG